MRIAMIGHKSILLREGGIEKTVRNLSFFLTEKGHQVTVYDRGNYYSTRGNDRFLSASIKNQILTDEKLRIIRIPTVSGAGEVPLYSFFAALHAGLSQYDVVMIHASGPCRMIPIVRILGKKVVAFIHGLDSKSSKWGRFASAYLSSGEKTAAKKADELLVLSEHIQTYFREIYGRKATLVFNGIDDPRKLNTDASVQTLDEYGLHPDGYLIWSGRISPEKGLQYLIPAFRNCHTDKMLVLAGEVDDRKGSFYHKILSMCNNNHRIRFIGNQFPEKLQELYTNAYAFVFPSEQEGMAHSLLEAQASGSACLLSDIPENRAVAKEHALYFQSKDIEDLEKKLQYLLNHPEERTVLTKEQTEDVLRDFSWQKSAEQIMEVCEKVLGK